ncbi:MAG: hypothetical protein AAF843_12165 [Bacteroidota bacterium]
MLAALILALFFMVYHGVGSKIKNKRLSRLKWWVDYYAVKFLRRFAYTSNKELFNSYYKTSIKAMRVMFIGCIVWALIGANPLYFSFLFVASILLIISFTSPKQFKKDIVSGFKFWTTNIGLSALGFSVIWLLDLKEGTNHFDQLTTVLIQPMIQIQQSSRLPPAVFWTVFALFLIFMFCFNILFWLFMRGCAWIGIYILRAYARLSFWLNKRQPLAPLHLTGQILAVIVTYLIAG